MTTIKLDIHEIKSHFSKYVDLVERGETVIVKRNFRVAEIRPIHKAKRRKSALGAAKGRFVIPPEFYEPFPEDLLEAFEGHAGRRGNESLAGHGHFDAWTGGAIGAVGLLGRSA